MSTISNGINWLFTGRPGSNYGYDYGYAGSGASSYGGYGGYGYGHGGGGYHDGYRPASVLGYIGDTINEGVRGLTGGLGTQGWDPQDEYYVSERVHAFLKSMQPEMQSMCNAPMDVVFHHYHGGSFMRPNGFIYDQSRVLNNMSRSASRRGRCVAIITMAEDPKHRFGQGYFSYNSSMPSSYLRECAMECVAYNQVEGIILTNYRSWMYVHIQNYEPMIGNMPGGRFLNRLTQLRTIGDPRFAPMIRVTYSHAYWGGHDSTRRQLMYLIKTAHRHKLENRLTHLHSSTGRAIAAIQMVTDRK